MDDVFKDYRLRTSGVPAFRDTPTTKLELYPGPGCSRIEFEHNTIWGKFFHHALVKHNVSVPLSWRNRWPAVIFLSLGLHLCFFSMVLAERCIERSCGPYCRIDSSPAKHGRHILG